MNEFERRMIDLAQNHVNLQQALKNAGGGIIEPYVYTGVSGSVAAPIVAGANAQITIPIQADSYFVLSYITCAVVLVTNQFNLAPATQQLIQITDTGNGSVFYSQPQIPELVCGSAPFNVCGIPILITVPRVIMPNTNLKVDIAQYGPSITQFYISFFGQRVYSQ